MWRSQDSALHLVVPALSPGAHVWPVPMARYPWKHARILVPILWSHSTFTNLQDLYNQEQMNGCEESVSWSLILVLRTSDLRRALPSQIWDPCQAQQKAEGLQPVLSRVRPKKACRGAARYQIEWAPHWYIHMASSQLSPVAKGCMWHRLLYPQKFS